jgi:hypothetical protein
MRNVKGGHVKGGPLGIIGVVGSIGILAAVLVLGTSPGADAVPFFYDTAPAYLPVLNQDGETHICPDGLPLILPAFDGPEVIPVDEAEVAEDVAWMKAMEATGQLSSEVVDGSVIYHLWPDQVDPDMHTPDPSLAEDCVRAAHFPAEERAKYSP